MRKQLNRYFIPQRGNRHQPYLLRRRSLGKILFLVILIELVTLFFVTPLSPLPIKHMSGNLSTVFSSVLVNKANETRLKENKNELIVNEQLVAAAQLKADDMATKGYFSHNTPDGKTPWYFLDQVGYKYKDAGENLAVNFTNSYDVHRAWLNSPKHKDNIVRESFEEIGVATAKGKYKGNDAVFVVQFFGRPKTSVNIANMEGIKALVFEEIATSPRLISTIVLVLIAGILLLSIFLKIFIKIKIQYPKMILGGLVVVALIVLFIFANNFIVGYFGEII